VDGKNKNREVDGTWMMSQIDDVATQRSVFHAGVNLSEP
jgi:acyl-CoA hydrolase